MFLPYLPKDSSAYHYSSNISGHHYCQGIRSRLDDGSPKFKNIQDESNPFINDKGQKHMNPEKLKCTMTMFFQLVIIESATFSFPVKPKLVTQVSRQVTPSF